MRLTKAQEQILNMERVTGGASGNIGGRILFKTSCTPARMEEILNTVFTRNDAFSLRLTVNAGHYEWAEVAESPAHYAVRHFASLEELDAYGERVARTPFDLQEPLYDFEIVYVGDLVGIVGRVHHLIGDAWSISLLGWQIGALLAGEAFVGYSYREYIAQSNAYLQSQRHQRDGVFFASRLASRPEPLGLPCHQPESFRSERKTLVIPREQTAQICAFAEENNAYPFAVLLTGVAACLSRLYGNRERLCLGMTALNRAGVRENNTFGLFVSSLPLVLTLRNEASFRENMSAVIDECFATLRHARYTCEEIQEQNAQGGRLYEVLFNYQTAKLNGDKTSNRWYRNDRQWEPLQIHVNDHDDEKIFRINYDYRTDSFTAEQIERFHDCLCRIVRAGIESDIPVAHLPMLGEEELARLRARNPRATEDPFALYGSVCTRITQQAQTCPDRVAVYASDATVTYARLERESNRIANALLARGIKPGDRVAVLLPRNGALHSALLGVLKTGAAYVPIDPDLPRERVEYLLQDSGAACCIEPETVEVLLREGADTAPSVIITPEMPCYCIYTSGSTGKPKGAVITHGNLANYIAPAPDSTLERSLQGVQAIVSVTTVSFDIFVTESFLPLANGMTVVLADEEQSRSQERLNVLLRSHSAQALQTTPSKLRVLTADPDKAEYLRALRVILLGGEAADPALIRRIRSLTDARIHNYYGPTETTVWVTCGDITDGDITIGTPLANTRIYLLDAYGNLLPDGAVGELCIAGLCVGAGYLNRPELTAERFIDDPFGEGKLYHTGDLAYRRKDGGLVFVGRRDFQVKIRGQRVELGEIESALLSLAEITQAVALVRPAEDGSQMLCAFYSGQKLPVKEIRRSLSGLPVYMIPNRFIYLEKIPLTPTGKVDRKALSAGRLPAEEESCAYVPPHTPEEKLLTGAVNEVLHRDRTGMEDNFLLLGGDSLKAIELVALLEEKGYTLPVKAVLLCRDMQALAREIEPALRTKSRPADVQRLPATAAQRRIFAAQEWAEDPLAYHISFSMDAAGIDTARLQSAVQSMLLRHESLRTHFELAEDGLWQVIDPTAVLPMEYLEPGDTAGFVRPFALDRAPLMRLGCDGSRVLFDFHHLVFDGASIPVFFRELDALYHGRELPLPVPYRASLAPYAAEDESYWCDMYACPPEPLRFGAGLAAAERGVSPGETHFGRVEESLHRQIQHRCAELRITPFSYYFAAYGLLLSLYGQREDFSIGVPMAGRDARSLHAVGVFVNTVPLRCTLDRSDTVEQYLKKIASLSAEAFSHQMYPYGQLLKDLGRAPAEELFSTLFAYQNEVSLQIDFADRERRLCPLPIQAAQFDLSLHLAPEAGGLLLGFTYRPRCLSAQTVEQMETVYGRLLLQMLDGSVHLAELSPLSAADAALLRQMDQTDAPLPEVSTLYACFLAQTCRTPDALCLVGAAGKASFRGFADRVACLGNHIRILTGGRKQPIAVLTDRGPELYLALYAVVGGGNAYVPIAPTDPPERIRFLLQDSGVELVLAQDPYAHLAGNLPVLSLTAAWCDPLSADPAPFPCAACPEDIAYILYTSGSTGRAKGVRIRNRSVVNRILWMQKHSPLTHDSVILGKTPYTFDVSVWEIFWWGMYGGRLAYMAPEEHFLPERILSAVEKYRVTHLHFVPSVFALFLEYLEAEPCRREGLRSVEHIFLSGEVLSAALVRRMHALCPGIHLHNLYGPTECTVDVSVYDCTGSETDPVPIGTPIDNTRLYVLDGALHRLPVGVQGELCIAGAGVGAGYVNRSALTKEKFVPNPFGDGKLYHTGDQAYVDRHGRVIFCGRKDTQIKLHGQRVELGEIETVLRRVPGVGHVCVLAREHFGKMLLVAYYDGAEKLRDRLPAYCAQSLPRHMIPAAFVSVSPWPVTQNGKADRTALAALPVSLKKNEKTATPADELERQICASFRTILRLEQVGRNTDFFRAGGTSLDVIAFLSSQERYAGLSAAAFVRDPTPAGIAARLREQTDHSSVLQILRQAEGEELLVIVPFAGGGAEAFAALTAELSRRRPELAVAFLPYPREEAACRLAAAEIARVAGHRRVYFYGHCVGSVAAMRMVRILETEYLTQVPVLFSAAYIPADHALNIWHFTPDWILRKILSKAGSRIRELPARTAEDFLADFRADAAASAALLSGMGGKCAARVYSLLSPQDLFTPHIDRAAREWARFTTGTICITPVESRSHYFQATMPSVVADWILSGLEPLEQ